MKYLYATILLLLASSAFAQNPPGVGVTDRTPQGATILISPGGVAPYTLYRPDGSGGRNYVTQTNSLTIVVNTQAPNTVVTYNLTGAGVAPGSGIPVTIQSLPVPPGPFQDVPENHWAVWQIAWMKDAGITNGCGNDNYCPDANVTRAQMAVFMCNLANVLQPGTCVE